MILEGHDGAPADRFSQINGRIGAAVERMYLFARFIKTKEDFLGPATTDDEEDDFPLLHRKVL